MFVPFLLLPLLAASLFLFIRADFGTIVWKKTVTKSIASLLFVAIALLSYIVAGTDARFFFLLLVAQVFAMAGDVLLVYGEQKKAMFAAGLLSFLLTHIVLIVNFSTRAPFSLWDVLLWVALVGGCLLAHRPSGIKLGDMKLPALVYLCAISLMVSKAASLLYRGVFDLRGGLLAAVGAALFMASDVFLLLYDFRQPREKALRVANLITYYGGQALIALSVLYA